METTKRIIEVNGIKMEIDLSTAKRIDNFKVGDNIKVLVKDYSDYKSYIGVIIGFDNFEKTPTIVIAYLKTQYNAATIEFLYYNSKTEGAEITTLNAWDIPVTKTQIIKNFSDERKKKEVELLELNNKEQIFETLFGKYFETSIGSKEDSNF